MWIFVLVKVHEQVNDNDVSDEVDSYTWFIKYHFGPEYLHLKNDGLTLNFCIGEKPI